MKKKILLLTALLAAVSAVSFAGCSGGAKNNTPSSMEGVNSSEQTEILTLDENSGTESGEPHENCPKRRMHRRQHRNMPEKRPDSDLKMPDGNVNGGGTSQAPVPENGAFYRARPDWFK